MPGGVYIVDDFQAPPSVLAMSADGQIPRIGWTCKTAGFLTDSSISGRAWTLFHHWAFEQNLSLHRTSPWTEALQCRVGL